MTTKETMLVTFSSINYKSKETGNRLDVASKHNKRTIPHGYEKDIDSTRSHLNQSLLGLPATPEGVFARSEELMKEAGFVPDRRDACIAVEVMFSLREQPRNFSMTDYFTEAAMWAGKCFKGHLLSADVHLDQPHPHCHVLVLLPLANVGLSGSKLIGFKRDSNKRARQFHEEVASRYGLSLPPPGLSHAEKQMLARQVHEQLQRTGNPARASSLWPFIAKQIDRDPRGAAIELGGMLQTNGKPYIDLAALAQTSGRGPRTEHRQCLPTRKGVGGKDADSLGCSVPSQKTQHPSCVGVQEIIISAALPGAHIECTRERLDCDQWGDIQDGCTPSRSTLADESRALRERLKHGEWAEA